MYALKPLILGLAALALGAAESITIERVALPTREGEKPACVSLPEDERTMVYHAVCIGLNGHHFIRQAPDQERVRCFPGQCALRNVR